MDAERPSIDRAASGWRAAVRVHEDTALEQELAPRLAAATGARAISVTDLTNPRPAYWRRHVTVARPPEVQARLDAGVRWHLWLGTQLGPAAALEVRVRRDGIVGQIDALTDVPIELKTTGTPVGVDELPRARPEYIEQLAMYCGLLGRPTGRLSILVTRGDDLVDARVADVVFRDPAAVWTETQRRATRLRTAWEAGRPEGLSRCARFGRGCEFQQEGACDCTGEEAPPTPTLLDAITEIREDPEAEAAWRTAAQTREIRRSPVVQRFRNLLYPRQAYFERTRPEVEDPAETQVARSDPIRNRLAEALEGGAPGELARRAPRTEEPEEAVSVFRGAPYLLRAWRTRTLPSAEEIVERQPQYAIELGFRCAALGENTARVFLAGQPGPDGAVPLRVYEYRFDPVGRFSRLWRERARDLARAFEDRDPSRLEACPAWMARDCRFQPECGCPSEAGRAQR